MSSTTLINPADETVIGEVRAHLARAGRRGGRAARVAAQAAWAALAPADRAAALRRFAAAVDGAVEELAAARGAQLRASDRLGALGGRARARRARLLRGRARAADRPADPGRRRHRRDLPRAARRRRRDRAVELPDDDRLVGLRSGARRGQRRAAEARRLDAAHRDPPRRARARVRAARGPVPGAAGPRLGRGRALRHPRAGAQGRLHRIDRGRQAGGGRMRGAGQAGHPRARRQERQRRLRRLPTSSGRPRRHPARCSTTPGRTAARAAASWSSAACSTASSSCSSRPCKACQGRRARRRGAPRWARSSRRRTATRCSAFLDDATPVAFRGSAPDGPRLLDGADRAAARPRTDRVADRRDLRPGGQRAARSTTRPTRSRSRTTASTGSPARSGRATSAAPSASRAASSRGTLSVNSHSSVRYTTPFGGVKQSGLGRELGPDAALAFTETKNVFFAAAEEPSA